MSNWFDRTFKPVGAIPIKGAQVIPFPGVDVDLGEMPAAYTPPRRLARRRVNAHSVKAERIEDFVAGLARANKAVVHELRKGDRLRLAPDQLEKLQHTDPYTCQLCGAPVYPLDAMWWDMDGELHNRTCRPEATA